MGASASSRQKFQESIEALSREDVPREDTEFWDELWKLKTTTETVFELISPTDVRRLRAERPENLHTLFDQAVCQLCLVIQTPLPIYFDHALNCVRVLTRLLPFMLENPHDAWVKDVCWSPGDGGSSVGGGGGGSKDGSGGGGGSTIPSEFLGEPLGQLAVHAIMHLLFLPGFTVDAASFDVAVVGEHGEGSEGGGGGGGGEGKEANLVRKQDPNSKKKPLPLAASNVQAKRAATAAAASAAATGEGGGGGEESSLAFAVRHPAAVWAPGLVGQVDEDLVVRSAVFDKNRVEVLRLLLAMLCEPLFVPADFFDPFRHGPWSVTCTAKDVPFASLLFHSLLNTVLDFDPCGWGVPYGANVSRAGAPTKLLEKAAQVLVVLLDFGANSTDKLLAKDPKAAAAAAKGAASNANSAAAAADADAGAEADADAEVAAAVAGVQGGGLPDVTAQTRAAVALGKNQNRNQNHQKGGEPSSSSTSAAAAPPPAAASTASSSSSSSSSATNVFVELLKTVGSRGRGYEYATVFEGITRLLNNVHEAQNTYLPGSVMEIECHQELLVLLWKFLEENEGFMPYVLKHCDVTSLVVPIAYFMFEARKDAARVGLVHICTFILLKLSGERNFCVQLNKPFEVNLPCYEFPLFTGTHTDLLVLVLHKLVVNGVDKLAPLYNCFLTIICNVSPYTKQLCLLSSVKLVSLFELFTSHRFLYGAQDNHVYVSLLLEVFNNVVQYQYAGNPHLVYAIVRRRAAFEALSALTLPQAQEHASAEQSKLLKWLPPSTTSLTAPAPKPPASAAGKGGGIERRLRRQEEEGGGSGGGGGGGVPTESTKVVDTTETHEEGSAQEAVGSVRAEQPLSSSDGEGGAAALSSFGGAGDKPNAPSQFRFVPNSSWLAAVKNELPLTTILRLLQHLVPQIDELVRRSEGAIDDATIMSFLTNTTMVGLLPVPHPIVIRKYTPNRFTGLWFTAFMWGVVFLNNQLMPLFDGATIKLFTVTVAAPPSAV